MPPRRPPQRPDRDGSTQIRKEQRPPPPPVPGGDGPPRRHSGSYQTGSDYPVADDESLLSDGEGMGSSGADGEKRDIYGEDDPLPDESELEPSGIRRRDEEDDSPESTRAGPPRKLVIIAGPDKGRVKRFDGVRMVVGRTNSCNLHLQDASVSRRHLELVQGASGVMLRDLGSGNGTKVNGEKITERLLKHDDVIEIGQTQLQFVDEVEAVRIAREAAERREEEERKKGEEEEKQKAEAEAAAKAEAEGAGARPADAAVPSDPALADQSPVEQVKRAFGGFDLKAKIGLGLAGGAVLFVLFLLLPALFHPAGPPPMDPKEALANKKMDLARVAVTDERWDDAVDLLESAERLHPGVDTDGLLERAHNEQAAGRAVASAREKLNAKDFAGARTALQQLPELTAKRAEEAKKLQLDLDRTELEFHKANVETALAAGDIDGARAELNAMPESERKLYLPRLADATRRAQEDQLHAQQQQSVQLERRRRAAAAARQAELDSQFLAVERKFDSGDFDRAVLECDRVIEGAREGEVRSRAQSLKRLIPMFQRSFDDGEKKYRAHAMESAVYPLKRARDLYGQIGFSGRTGATLDDHLVESLDAAGKAALLRNDVSSAASAFKDASKIAPGDPQAKQGLERVAQRAEDIYLEGYMIRDRDPRESANKYRMVLEVAPKGSATYEKAKAALAAMQP